MEPLLTSTATLGPEEFKVHFTNKLYFIDISVVWMPLDGSLVPEETKIHVFNYSSMPRGFHKNYYGG